MVGLAALFYKKQAKFWVISCRAARPKKREGADGACPPSATRAWPSDMPLRLLLSIPPTPRWKVAGSVSRALLA